MGYTDFDRALLDAWYRARERCKDDPNQLKKVLERRGMSTYTRPLRSWSLVLRACDSRIEDDNTQGLVRIDGARIKELCSPVVIPYPGVSLDDAARLFGVNRTTVSRWANPPPEVQGKRKRQVSWYQDVQGQIEEMSDMKYPPSTFQVKGDRLMLEHFVNRANVKRSVTRVWTPRGDGLDPGGAVWSADWGSLRAGLADKIDPSFVQQLQRVDRKLGSAERVSGEALARGASGGPYKPNPGAKAPSARVWQWVCPAVDGGCGRLVYKLYLPMPYATLVKMFGGCDSDESAVTSGSETPKAFLCLRCAGLVYESAERSASPGVRGDGRRRRVSDADRFVKRLSGQVVGVRDVLMGS